MTAALEARAVAIMERIAPLLDGVTSICWFDNSPCFNLRDGDHRFALTPRLLARYIADRIVDADAAAVSAALETFAGRQSKAELEADEETHVGQYALGCADTWASASGVLVQLAGWPAQTPGDPLDLPVPRKETRDDEEEVSS